MQKVDPDKLFRHSAILTAAACVAHPLNFGFQVVAGRLLSIAEYGTLAAVLGLLSVLGAPLTAIKMVVAHGAAIDPRNEGRLVFRRWLARTAILGLVSGIAMVLLADEISFWMNLGSPLVIWATAAAIVPIAINPVVQGRIQGLQAFRWLAILGVVAAGVRLVTGSLLMVAWPGASSGLFATAVATAVTLALGFMALEGERHDEEMNADRQTRPPLALGATALAVIGLAALQHLDLVIVKRVVDSETAGLWAQASLFGRSLPFLTLPMANALFPKTAALGVSTGRGRRLYLRAVIVAAGVGATAVMGFALAPAVMLGFVFGADRVTPDLVILATSVAPAFVPLAVTFPIVYAGLAGRRSAMGAILVAGMIALVSGTIAARGDLRSTVVVVAVVQTGVAITAVGYALARGRSGG